MLELNYKKKSNGEIFGKGIFQPVRFWFLFFKGVRLWKNVYSVSGTEVEIFFSVQIWNSEKEI